MIYSCYMCRNENPATAAAILDAKDFYVEPGNIMIAGHDSLRSARLSGTPTNNDLSVLTEELKPYQPERDKIEADYDALTDQQLKDLNTIAPIKARLKAILLKMAAVQFTFIKSHPQSYISVAILQQTVKNADLVQQNEDAFSSLSVSIKETALGIMLKGEIEAQLKTAIGSTGIDFELTDTLGHIVKFSDFKGKYILLDFWTSYCLPCREEMPNVIITYNKFKSKNFNVLGISIDAAKSRTAWPNAIKSDGAKWTQLLDDHRKVKTLYGITTTPANILMGPNGKIIARNLKDKVLLAKLDELLGYK